jgi:hypothetical protein
MRSSVCPDRKVRDRARDARAWGNVDSSARNELGVLRLDPETVVAAGPRSLVNGNRRGCLRDVDRPAFFSPAALALDAPDRRPESGDGPSFRRRLPRQAPSMRLILLLVLSPRAHHTDGFLRPRVVGY